MKSHSVVDLFSGCGGLSLGFQNAGYKIIAAFDKWGIAVDIYRKNFDHSIYESDLEDGDTQEKIVQMQPDIIIGGPPCQDFSSAGHRNVQLGRAELTLTFCDIVIKANPKYFLMENVPEITKSQHLKDVKMKLKKLESI